MATLDGGTFTQENTSSLNLGYVQPFWLTLDEPIEVPKIVGTTDITSTYLDREYDTSSTNYGDDIIWSYSYEADRPTILEITRESSDELIISPDPDDIFRWIFNSAGTATLTIETSIQSVSEIVTVGSSTSPIKSFSHFLATSCARVSADAFDTLIAGKTTASKPMYSVYDPTTNTFTRNTSCWAASLDLTSVSAWNSYDNARRAGTLISPRHILFANHYSIPNGSTLKFIKMDNTIVERTLTTSYFVQNDLVVGLLDSDVPAGINFVKILPSTWATKLPVPSSIGGLAYEYPYLFPVMKVDQEKKAIVADTSSADSSIYFKAPTDSQRLTLYEDLIGGDSGSPCYAIIDDELVLLTVWYSGGGGGGGFVSYYITQINAAMTALGGGYQLTAIDLSSYPSY